VTKPAFEIRGRVEAVLIGMTHGSIATTRVQKIQVVRGHGVKGDGHAGARLCDAREKELLAFGFAKGIEIANHREFSAVSVEELEAISAALHAFGPVSVPYGALGENLGLAGIPKLTELPPRTLLFFRKPGGQPRSAVLAVWGENTPCIAPGEELQRLHPHAPGLASAFPKAAAGRRGIVGSVYASGVIHEGDEVVAKIPRQRIYDP